MEKLIKIVRVIFVLGLLIPITILGHVFYSLSKLIRSFAYLLLFAPHSAKKEVSETFKYSYTSLKDIL